MRTKQEYLDLLKETVNFYTTEKNERAFNNTGGCSYYFQGNMCAVGRCLINPRDKDKKLGDQNTAKALILKYKHRVFKKDYRDFEINFWELLQEFHDGQNNISDFKITEDGEQMIISIEAYINNLFKN